VALVVDTSGLYALIDADDAHHFEVRRFVEASTEALIIPITVIPEADDLVATRLGLRVELGMLRAIVAGEFSVEQVTQTDIDRCLALIETYGESNIGFVDASVVAVAERLKVTRVLTLDRRHFGMIRPAHCPALDLLP